MKEIIIDIDVAQWKLREQIAYRKEVGVNPQYALMRIAKAFSGGESDEVPDEALNIPAEWLVGLAWVTMSRKKPDLTMDGVIDAAGTYEALVDAFATAISPEEEPRPTTAGRTKTASARKTA